MTDESEWYWDLERGTAVPARDRRLASNTLGPYGSRAEAERWQETVEARNDEWDEADEAWRGDEDDRATDGSVDR